MPLFLPRVIKSRDGGWKRFVTDAIFIQLLRCNILTEHFKILEPRNQEIDKLYKVEKYRSTDFEALNL